MREYNKGSAILLEVEFKKRLPFGETVYFNPSSATIKLYDPSGNKKLQDSLTNHETGQFYYIMQTEELWTSGVYKILIESTDNATTDISISYIKLI